MIDMINRIYDEEKDYWYRHIQNSIYWQSQKSEGLFLEDELRREIISIPHLRKQQTLNIIDLGCGPISTLGTKDNKYKINLLGVDPLTNFYTEILDKHYLSRPHPAINMECENIGDIADSLFDVVFSRNALDHSESPDLILEGAKKICKNNGLIHIRMYENEATSVGYNGLHQWDATYADNDVIMSSKTYNRQFSISSILGKLKITNGQSNRPEINNRELKITYIKVV